MAAAKSPGDGYTYAVGPARVRFLAHDRNTLRDLWHDYFLQPRSTRAYDSVVSEPTCRYDPCGVCCRDGHGQWVGIGRHGIAWSAGQMDLASAKRGAVGDSLAWLLAVQDIDRAWGSVDAGS